MRLNCKTALLSLAYIAIAVPLAAQLKVGGNAAVIRGDAALEIGTQRKGFLLPRVSSAALGVSPLDTAANGMLVFNTDLNRLMIKNSGWKQVADASAIEYLWTMAGNTNVDPALHFLGTAGPQPLVFKTNLAEAMRIDANGNTGIGTSNPSSRLHVNGSLATNLVVATNSPYAATADDYTIIVTPAGGAGNFQVTLPPAASGKGRIYVIKRFDGSTPRPVEVVPTGADDIDGSASFSFDAVNLSCYTFQSDGVSRWYVISKQ
ncbi:hypothetical protein [Chitinophaga cymbidii]|uniref:Uncharacterized protein n=1 Tax=Chitinophaga cymbidii TaxID=1096750 RepID=A0A512RE73_9BACT|nr:hypothetical protein [Chitinophaga cymbidii]GEP93993.1 hypothetical protein CCY01nite_02530 [Chitinophaga cymbidii]